MANLPLTIAGQVITNSQLAGFRYISAFPELMQLLQRHIHDPLYGYALAPCFIYPFSGTQKIWAQPGRAWQQGQSLRAVRFGNDGNYRNVLVHDYDYLTGELWIEVMGSSTFETPVIGANGYYLIPYFPQQISASAYNVDILYGGTASNNVDSIRENCLLPAPRRYQMFFSDFVHGDSYCRVTLNGADCGPAHSYTDNQTIVPDNTGAISPLNHPGVFRLFATATGGPDVSTQSIAFGRPYILDWSDFAAYDDLFEASFFIDSANCESGVFQVGLIGVTARIALAVNFSVSTITIDHGTNNTIVSDDATTEVTFDAWHTIAIHTTSSDIGVWIDGTLVSSFDRTQFGLTSPLTGDNLMTPLASVTTGAFVTTTTSTYIDYMYFRKNWDLGAGR